MLDLARTFKLKKWEILSYSDKIYVRTLDKGTLIAKHPEGNLEIAMPKVFSVESIEIVGDEIVTVIEPIITEPTYDGKDRIKWNG